MLNPIRLIKNLFVDFLIAVSGTYVGSFDAAKNPLQDTESSNSQAE